MFERKLELKPLYSLPDSVNDEIFDHVEFDEVSKQLIAKSHATDDRSFKRHAVVGWIPLTKNAANEVISRTRPGLPSTANSLLIQKAETTFGENLFVVAKDSSSSVGTGIVHTKTIEQIEKNEPELENTRNSKYKYIALSFTVRKKDDKIKLSWVNRSAQNMQLFIRDELALACLTFPDVDEIKLSEHIGHTLAYHLNRSIPKAIFKRYLKAAEKALNLSCTYQSDECYSFVAEENWKIIMEMENKIKQKKCIEELLMTNLYIASALPPETHSKNRSRNGYELDIINIFNVAKKHELSIDPDFIPIKFMEDTNNATALIMAAKGGHVRIVELLIENGADPDKRDSNNNTPLLWAIKNGHFEIVKLLIKNDASIDLDVVMQCKDHSQCINMIKWAAIYGNAILQDLPSTSSFSNLFQNPPETAELKKYIKRCQLISSQISKELDALSARHEAVNALYEFAKECKTENELTDEISFFSKLDAFINPLKPEIKEKCLSIYTRYEKAMNEQVDRDQIKKNIEESLKNIIHKLDIDKNEIARLLDEIKFIETEKTGKPTAKISPL